MSIDQEKDHVDKRTALISAAIEVFSYEGFQSSRVADIAEKAGVATGTVYLYFRNKDDILMTIFQEFIESKLGIIKEKLEREDSLLKKLYRFLNLHIDFLMREPLFAKLMAVELYQNSKFKLKYPDFKPLSMYQEYLEEIIEQGVANHEIRGINPQAMAYVILGTMHYLIMEWILEDKTFDLEEMRDNISSIVLEGLLP